MTSTDPKHLLDRQPGDVILWKGPIPHGWQVMPNCGSNWISLDHVLIPDVLITRGGEPTRAVLLRDLPDVNYIMKLDEGGSPDRPWDASRAPRFVDLTR